MNQTKIEKKDNNAIHSSYDTKDFCCKAEDIIKDSYQEGSFYVTTDIKPIERKEIFLIDKTMITKPEITITSTNEKIESREEYKETTVERQKKDYQQKEITLNNAEQFKAELKRVLHRSKLEIGEISEFEEYVSEKIDTNRDLLLKTMTELYLEYADKPYTLMKILEALAELEYKKIRPEGTMIALSALNHQKTGVVRSAMRAFGKWKKEEYVKALENVKTEEEWVRRYRDKIIKGIKGSKKYANVF